MNKGLYGMAVPEYMKALNIFKQKNDSFSISHISINLGINYEKLNEWDSTLHYYLQAEHLATQTNDNRLLSLALYNKAGAFKKMERFDESKDLIKRSKQLAQNSGDSLLLFSILTTEIQLSLQQGHGKGAKELLDQSLLIAKKLQYPSIFLEYSESEMLYWAYQDSVHQFLKSAERILYYYIDQQAILDQEYASDLFSVLREQMQNNKALLLASSARKLRLNNLANSLDTIWNRYNFGLADSINYYHIKHNINLLRPKSNDNINFLEDSYALQSKLLVHQEKKINEKIDLIESLFKKEIINERQGEALSIAKERSIKLKTILALCSIIGITSIVFLLVLRKKNALIGENNKRISLELEEKKRLLIKRRNL